MTLVGIVPYASAQHEGVGGYADVLADALLRQNGIGTEFLVGAAIHANSRKRPAPTRSGRPEARDLEGELEARGASAVLLHYSGYGYARRGVPSWLARELTTWRRRSAERRFVTVFHEVYATGPPWRSSFWLSPLQRRVAAALARHSDAMWTSLEQYAQLLGRWVDRGSVRVMPVFSTVGEPRAVPAIKDRAARMIVFGSAGVRARAYENPLPLERACRALNVVQILDVGPPAQLPSTVGGIPVEARGVLPAPEIGSLFLDSRAAFLCYEPRFLAKSTIFAAYAAHGLLPVCSPRATPAGREVRENEHYWRPDSMPGQGESRWQAIADAAHKWYRGHSLERQADAVRDMLA